ncbi:OLC1v1006073C1 [Oldenlandia corymbosa var. corymbosa]|uniref:OLC1v1006073C1 n=1 Tax=Oldenlandia corymbosa var. corymbosa TaxID=529605 RepID=A0AAV1DG90_OLDCO|nr:OLC1v1006073C1 [Oldenlandia corymbosa var. corymbosa]
MDYQLSRNDDEDNARKRRRIFVVHQVVTAVAIAVMWHEKHMVKEPRLDFSVARQIYLRRLYYGSDRVCKDQLRLTKHCFLFYALI